MSKIQPLQVEQLYRFCAPEQFDFETTAELADLDEMIGQDRAVRAVRFGIDIQRAGYNIFALGPSGTGKHSLIRRFLDQHTGTQQVPSDWCYVYNFDQPHKPRALELPPGMAVRLQAGMVELVADLRSALPTAFDSDEYRNRRQAIQATYQHKQEEALNQLQRKAQEQNVTLLRTQNGLLVAPTQNGEVVSPEEFQKLSAETRETIEAQIAQIEAEMEEVFLQSPRWERQMREELRVLNQGVTVSVIQPLLDELRQQFASLPAVLLYLDSVQANIVENARIFLESGRDGERGGPPQVGAGEVPDGPPITRRYEVNVMVDHGTADHAPILYESNPSYLNLVGRIENMAQMGALVTDFTLIKPGSLHQANGGYLILDARKVLSQSFGWEGLKRALQLGEIKIESPNQMLNLTSTVTLEPEPIPLDIKVALIGDPATYYLLSQHDPDFDELFKVAADFSDRMPRSDENLQRYAQLLATLARQESLRPLTRAAVARVIEHSSRLVGDCERLSTQMQDILDLLREADYWAGSQDHPQIEAEHVQQTIDAQTDRLDGVRERAQDPILREIILVDTQGSVIGQINGLSVLQLGKFAFGRPARITAQVSMGSGGVVDIEREVELGGPLHTKGVLILTGFLEGRYAQTEPLSLSARLVFEQSYGGVDGDSASSTELYVLLSAIARLPIRQDLAVTGSVNQYGQVQAIGGVNEKIEGFFDLCRTRGLSGEQGVLIPRANTSHLMLRRDVVEAVAEGKFHIFPVQTIDEGIELLTGVPAGQRDAQGDYPQESVNGRVARRLADLAARRRAWMLVGRDG